MGRLVGHLTWPGVTEPGSGALGREGLLGLGGRKGCRGLADGCTDKHSNNRLFGHSSECYLHLWPYHPERAQSPLISEDRLGWAWLIL